MADSEGTSRGMKVPRIKSVPCRGTLGYQNSALYVRQERERKSACSWFPDWAHPLLTSFAREDAVCAETQRTGASGERLIRGENDL